MANQKNLGQNSLQMKAYDLYGLVNERDKKVLRMDVLGLRSEYGYSVGSGEILEKKSILDAHGYTKIDYVTRVRKSLPGKLMY